MVELAVVGAKNSGKTMVIEGLVRYLVAEGVRVATVKHTSHGHQFDTPGKDSHRHRQAGALLTVAVSDKEVAVFAQPESFDIRQLQRLTGDSIHIWLIEGDHRADRPKVLVTRNLGEFSEGLPGNIVATIGPKRLNEVPIHFETDDYSGLGSFVCRTVLAATTELYR